MENQSVHAEDVMDMLSVIDDGFLFENFSQEFLSARLGYKFLSSGGIKDRGIDGLEYASEDMNRPTSIFQITIDKKSEQKLIDTLDKLRDNSINYSRLTYVTSVEVKNKDKLIDMSNDDYGINLRIFDAKWIADNCNDSPATQSVIVNFISRHLREMQKPGKEFVVNDFVKDPRLYVFLMQQIGRSSHEGNLNDKLIDSLILYSLRDTDPDKYILMTSDQIESAVREMFDFEVERLRSKINKRLKSLSKKPNKKINHHTRDNDDSYCLPYETRLKIIADNSKDKILYNSFMDEAESVLRTKLKDEEVQIKKLPEILKKIVELIYYQQGLEFSDFLLNGGGSDLFESNLSDTVDLVLDASNIIDKNRNRVKTALIMAIRDIVYSGSPQAKEYLKSLSKTYLMLFLMKCDPHIISYFQQMAGKMRIFVCTSILVPAFSEVYLEDQNKRYWSLLKSAKSRGVRLLVNDTILDELLYHIKNSYRVFQDNYKDNIDQFISGSEEFVDQILIRSFLYAKNENKVNSYELYLDNFVSINSPLAKQELIDFLNEEFGIDYVSSSTNEMKVNIDNNDLITLVNELSSVKGSAAKARADANLILTIYALRDMHGETKSSLEGYKTWWLSSDTATHRTVSRLFKQKYPVSCYMRPDFLYNYISFTPPKNKINALYENTFPNLLGVQISNHVSSDIGRQVRQLIIGHGEKSSGRVKAKIRQLSDELKTNTGLDYEDKLISFFNERL
ncbi:hypothetical protein PEC311524_32390 [Pectobacterium carotovorum subsp. carotovorum]|uniref:hypothetical protein n=1 Tax=Pectobacterium carotovorum TaxID=554 RepID=UPI001374324C|nr:hypothetical protein [Pectobacterium carotovorum]QHP52723.1 hypothetical protein EH203_01895 [Pectobacterium carotovorum subsp. carotovorum]GKW25645.1 hypothetical protein PEC311524_32390 [Pectobacterium carotovorum subsp. carotovorum]